MLKASAPVSKMKRDRCFFNVSIKMPIYQLKSTEEISTVTYSPGVKAQAGKEENAISDILFLWNKIAAKKSGKEVEKKNYRTENHLFIMKKLYKKKGERLANPHHLKDIAGKK